MKGSYPMENPLENHNKGLSGFIRSPWRFRSGGLVGGLFGVLASCAAADSVHGPEDLWGPHGYEGLEVCCLDAHLHGNTCTSNPV